MELKPGYKLTEVGVIPVDWVISTAAAVCEMVVDCKNRTPPVVEFGEFAVVRTPNVRNGKFVWDELRYTDEISFKTWTERAIPQAGDILITREAPLGEVCLVPIGLRLCLGQRMMLYRPAPTKVLSGFLLYALMSTAVRVNLLKKIGGSTVGHAKVEDIRNLQVPLPANTEEQRAIATALSDVDSLRTKLDQLITKKRDLKQAAMQQLLTGQTRLPGYRGEWVLGCLGEVVTFHKGKGLPKSELNPSGVERCIHYGELFTQYPAIIGQVFSRTNMSGSAFRSVANDVLMPTSDVTPRGLAKASCILENGVILGGDILVIRSKPNLLCGSFLSYLIRFEEEQILQLVTGSTVFHLYGSDMKNFSFAMPSLAEQTAIATALADMDTELVALEARRVKTQAIKQGMMQELLTGKTRLI